MAGKKILETILWDYEKVRKSWETKQHREDVLRTYTGCDWLFWNNLEINILYVTNGKSIQEHLNKMLKHLSLKYLWYQKMFQRRTK